MRHHSFLIMLASCVLFAAPVAAEEVAVGGRVLAAGGTPLPKAEVRLLPLRDSLGQAIVVLRAESPEAVARSRTDTEGRYRLVAPRAGLWQVRIDAPGFVPMVTELQPLIEEIELPDAELASDSGMTVKITDAEGSPLDGARVLLRVEPSLRWNRSRWNAPLRGGETAEDGTLRLPRSENERSRVSASFPGLAHVSLRGLRGTAATIALARGVPQRLDVRSASGSPVGGVTVALGSRPHPVGVSDDAGRLTVHADPSRAVEMRLLAEDGRRLETRLDVAERPEDDDPPRRLELPDRVTLGGGVIDAETRRAVGGALVWEQGNPIEGVVTGKSGGFELAAVAGSRLRITAGAPGYLGARPVEVQLLEDGRDGPTLALRPAAAITGKVVDEEGRAIAGAEVALQDKPDPSGMRFVFGDGPELPRSVTDARGSFRLGPVDPEGRYILKASAEGFAAAERPILQLEPYRTTSDVRLALTRGQSIRGTVVDTSGNPLADVDVKLEPGRSGKGMPMMMMQGDDEESVPFTSTSDGRGRFEIAGVPAGSFDLEARRGGFAKKKVTGIEIAEDAEPLDLGEITLDPGETIQGFVVDGEGVALEGVEVFLKEGPSAMMMMAGGGVGTQEAEATTDPSGWFSVGDLASGERYSLHFQRTGYVAKNVDAVQVPRVEPLEIAMDAASKVSGQVLDGEGEPIGAAEVRLSRTRTLEMGGNVMRMMMALEEAADSEGRFTFEDEEPGRISLSALASGFQEAKLDNLEVPRGEDLEGVVLTLPQGSVVQGQVFASDGRPVIGAVVLPVSEDGSPFRFGGGRSDGNGFYRLEGLAPGPISIEAKHDDHPRTVKDLEVTVGTNEFDLHFEGGLEVSGRVGDTAGTAIGDAVVRLVPVGRVWGGPETHSEADGSFKLTGIVDGDYQIWAEAEGYAPSGGEQTITVAGEPVQALEVQLDPGGTIYGKVSGVDPQKFRDVTIRADAARFSGFNTTAVDYEGRYRLEHLRPGTYEVVASLADSARQAKGEATLEAGVAELQVDLQFATGLTLSGRALQGEDPVSSASLFVEGLEVEHEAWTQTGPRGEFSVDGLRPGRYRLHLRDWRSGLAHNEEVDLATSREIELRIPDAHVSGRIVDGTDAEPLAGVSVVLQSREENGASWLPPLTASTDLEGKFELRNVSDGSWRLSATKKGYAAVNRSVNVQYQKSPEDLRIAMDPSEGLILEVRLPSGSPPEMIRAAVLDPTGGTLLGGNYFTGENGRVRLSSVPPGDWTLIVSSAGAATSSVQARAPGATVPVSLQPPCGLSISVPELKQSDTVATVRLRDGQGRPFQALNWSARPQTEWRMTGERLEFRRLPPGSWTVTVSTADGRSWEGSAVTSAEATADLVLE